MVQRDLEAHRDPGKNKSISLETVAGILDLRTASLPRSVCVYGESRPDPLNDEERRRMATETFRKMCLEHPIEYIADSLDDFIPEIKKGSERVGPWLDRLQHKIFLLVSVINVIMRDGSSGNVQLYGRMRAELYRFINTDVEQIDPEHGATLRYCLQQLDIIGAEVTVELAESQ